MKPIIIILLFLSIINCSLEQNISTKIIFSNFPHNRFIENKIILNIKYLDNNKTISLSKNNCIIDIPKGIYVPIIAYPIMEDNRQIKFFCTGAVYPIDYNEGKIFLSWKKGFAAELLFKLKQQGYAIESFNIERFYKEIEQRADGDPWSLDYNKIIENISKYYFRADYLKPEFTYELDITIPFDSLISENLLKSPLIPNENNQYHLTLINGMNNFYSIEENHIIHFSVSEIGWIYFDSNNTLSGYW